MWANADDHTKKVFCDLADLGRVTYRIRLAEWKEREDLITANGGNRSGQDDQEKGKKTSSSKKKGSTKRQSRDSQAYCASTTAASSDVTPQVAPKPFLQFPFAASTPLLHKPSIPSSFVGQHSITPSFNANDAERAYFAQAAMEAAMASAAYSFEPLSVPTVTTKKVRTHEYERRVSVDTNTVISNEMEQLYLRSNMGQMIPPPPLFVQESSPPHRLVSSNSFSSDQEVTPSSSIEREDEMPQDLDVSAQDFMDLIAHLESSTESNPEVKKESSQVFGKPMFDVETMSPNIGPLLPSREEEEVVTARTA